MNTHRFPRSLRLVLWYVVVLFLASCSHSDSERDATSGDLFKMREYGEPDHSQRTEPEVQREETSSDGYAWAPDGRTIIWHYVPEIEAKREEVEAQERLFDTHFAGYAEMHLMDLRIDFADPVLNGFELEQFVADGNFIGVGRPFSDSVIHMFECSSRNGAPRYLFEEHLFQCASYDDDGMLVSSILWRISAGPSPELREHYNELRSETKETGYILPGPPPQVSERWYWFLVELMKQSVDLHRPGTETDCSQRRPLLEAFVYSESDNRGAAVNYPMRFDIRRSRYPRSAGYYFVEYMSTLPANCRPAE